jgi:enoyl-CoA hydratase/carnithine racemase
VIDVITHGNVRELRLARPPANALSPELLAEICAQVARAPEEGAQALVLSGSKGLFTGGLDVPLLLSLDRQSMVNALDQFFAVMRALAESEVPVAAAITGHSPAGGAVLSLFCDWRVMADGPFVIGLNEVRIGIPIPALVAAALTRVVGSRRAEELCQSGRLLNPPEALETGLVDRVVPADKVIPDAIEWCRELTQLPKHALRETRRTVRRELIEIVDRSQKEDVETLVQEWFRPEVQRPLAELAAQLTGR